jgi:hypothetical protein
MSRQMAPGMPPPNRDRGAVARSAGLHSGLDLATSGVLAVMLLVALTGFGMELSLGIPLAILLGLTGQKFIDLIINSGKRDVFAPPILIAFYFTVYFGLRVIYLYYARFADSRAALNPYDDYLPAALWCACLGYISFSAGFSSRWGKRLNAVLPRGYLSWPRALPSDRILLVLGIGAVSSAYLFSIGLVVGDYSNPEFQRNPPPGLPILLETMLYLGWIAICVCLAAPQKVKGRRIAWPLLAVALVFLFARIAITGSKESLVLPVLQAMIVFHYLKRRLRVWELAAITVPTVLVAFGAVNFYRFVVVGENGGSPKSVGDVVSRVSSASDYLSSGSHSSGESSALEQLMLRDAGVDALALVMKYTPNPFPYTYGKDLLMLPLTFVPRKLWRDKPVSEVGHDFEHEYMGMPEDYIGFSSMHLISDLYRNFYFFGVAGGMFLVGATLRFFYRFASPASRNAAGVFLYAALFPALGRFLEGDIGKVLVEITRSGMLVVATGWLLRVRFRRLLPARPPVPGGRPVRVGIPAGEPLAGQA